MSEEGFGEVNLKSFENQWGDKLRFYDKHLEFVIQRGWKISGIGDKAPSQESGIFPVNYSELERTTFAFSKTSYSMITGRAHGYLRLGGNSIYFHSHNEYWYEARDWVKKRLYHFNPSKAKEREEVLDYETAIEIWEGLGQYSEAARIRKVIEERDSIKVDQTVVQGDQVTKTEIKDSVLNRSNVGGGSSKMQELKDLTEMKKEGLIDDDEFKQMKKEILGK